VFRSAIELLDLVGDVEDAVLAVAHEDELTGAQLRHLAAHFAADGAAGAG